MARVRKDRRDRRMDRKDFGSFNSRLTVPKEVRAWAEQNNKELRYVNDDKARIHQLFEQDWDFVTYIGGEVGEGESIQDMGSCYSTVVDKKENGEPMRGYLMCKERDWYKEDQKLKSSRIDEVDNEIRKGRLGNVENAYQPQDGSGNPLTKYKP